jgi:hypothetical protein
VRDRAATVSPPESDALARFGTWLLLAVVAAVRLGIAARFRGNFDSFAFFKTANLALDRRNFYSETDLYNYSPVWAGVLALVRGRTRGFLDFVFALGVLQTASDAASADLVRRIASKLGQPPDAARGVALLFFANPVSVVASCAHGQFDGLAILPLLAAILVSLPGGPRRHAGAVASLLTSSLLIKHVTLFQPFLFWKRVRRGGLGLGLVIAPFGIFAASFLPFASAWRRIWKNVIVYGAHGAMPNALPRCVDVPPGWSGIFAAALALAAACAIRGGRDLELPRASLLLWLTTLVFLPGFAMQYQVWPLAVGALYPSAGLGLYALAAGLFYSGSGQSLRLPWPVHVSELGVWASTAFWLATETIHLRREELAVSAGG